jgi:thymidylate synthase ThyX
LTINARNLELLFRRFASNPCAEVQELGRTIYDRIVEIAPSIIIFSRANPLDRDTYPQLHKLAGSYITAEHDTGSSDTHREVRLVDYTTDADAVIATALLHSSSDLSWEQCSAIVKKLSSDEKMQVYKTSWRNMQFYDSPIREFEYVNLTYSIILSAACFGQLKRHRMTSITAQPYNPRLGITIPVSIKEIGKADFFTQIAEKSAKLYDSINREIPVAAPYILTNAHRRRILLQTNARELYHIARLREDAHAQWDIQNISRAMSEQAREVMPMVCGLLGGKDIYTVMYQQIFGNLPAVTEAVLPGVKKIK